MKRTRASIFAVAVILSTAAAGALFGSALATWSAQQHTESAAQPPPATAAAAYAFQNLDAVVTGAAGRQGNVWVLARERTPVPGLVLYEIHPAAIARRIPLPLPDAGIQAGLTVAGDNWVWAGAGNRVVGLDPATGLTKITDLSLPDAVVPSARRAPDGTVLGLGHVASLTTDSSGFLWVARYATPTLTRLDVSSLQAQVFALPTSVDPDRLVSAGDAIWFTVNYGPSAELASLTGRIEAATGRVDVLPAGARSVVVRSDGVHAISNRWVRIDPVTLRTTAFPMPAGAFDYSTATLDAAGNLVLRRANQTRLLAVDRAAREARSVTYDQGTFRNREGQLVSVNARLAFAFIAGDGALWFGPQGGNAVFRVP